MLLAETPKGCFGFLPLLGEIFVAFFKLIIYYSTGYLGEGFEIIKDHIIFPYSPDGGSGNL